MRPHVEVDRVILGLELAGVRLGLRLARRPRTLVDKRGPLEVMVGARAGRAVLVVGDHVLERRRRTAEVERIALVGNGVEQDPARAQLEQVGGDRRDRVLAVLEEVVGDDEVDGLLFDRLQSFPVVDQLDRRKVAAGELGVVVAQVLDAHAVDVADVGPAGQRHPQVERADLQPRAAQELGTELGARIARLPRRRGR